MVPPPLFLFTFEGAHWSVGQRRMGAFQDGSKWILLSFTTGSGSRRSRRDEVGEEQVGGGDGGGVGEVVGGAPGREDEASGPLSDSANNNKNAEA